MVGSGWELGHHGGTVRLGHADTDGGKIIKSRKNITLDLSNTHGPFVLALLPRPAFATPESTLGLPAGGPGGGSSWPAAQVARAKATLAKMGEDDKLWAPEFGGRTWVSKVRDWPSQNGVFGFG